MASLAHQILVVGGNGFIGSAVCKAALARGMQVTSISSSGRPYQTPKGHTPSWASKVHWHKADAFDPATYSHILSNVSAVVHTLGTLVEDTSYKTALATGDVVGLVGGFFRTVAGSNESRLRPTAEQSSSYERLNRDSALRVCEAYVSSPPSADNDYLRSFVYISAEDIFRPIIPSRYIETKREAERKIEELVLGNSRYKSVYIRPSLVYHPHHRPLTSPIAALLDLSATLHAQAPTSLPTPAGALRTLGSVLPPPSHKSFTSSSPFESMANALTIPPIHVEHVAEAICIAVDPTRDVRGVVGVREMRELIGWSQKGQQPFPQHT